MNISKKQYFLKKLLEKYGEDVQIEDTPVFRITCRGKFASADLPPVSNSFEVDVEEMMFNVLCAQIDMLLAKQEASQG